MDVKDFIADIVIDQIERGHSNYNYEEFRKALAAESFAATEEDFEFYNELFDEYYHEFYDDSSIREMEDFY